MREIIPLKKFKSGTVVEVDAALFEPVGEWKKEKGKVEIVVNSGKNPPFDYEEFLSLLPASPNDLYHLVKKAFAQYQSDQWDGQEGEDDVLATIKSAMDLYQPNPREKFKNEGFAPFFEMDRISVDLEDRRVIISGRVEEDMNLVEHGVDILLQDGQAVFGYASDHEITPYGWDTDFIKMAFPQVNCVISPFVGFWDFGMGDTLEITEGRILYHSAWPKDQKPFQLFVKMCSGNHLLLRFENCTQEMVLKLDGNQLVSLDYDGSELKRLMSKAKL